MPRTLALLRLPMLLLCLPFVGCGGGDEQPHVVLISVDTLRADHLGAYGYTRPTSPRLDALARESIRFENAIAPTSWTLPSHVSLMTSMRPGVHGVADKRALAPAVVTLAEVLQEAGYATAAFTSWVYLSETYGFGQGFDRYRTLVDPNQLDFGGGGGAYRAGPVLDAVESWLQNSSIDDPLFLFVHLFDPHMDYAPPKDYADRFDPGYTGTIDGRYDTLKQFISYVRPDAPALAPRDLEHVRALYDAEIRYVDDQLARLLALLDRRLGLDDCLVVFVSDHGEEFFEHGSIEGHGWTLYEEIIHVPMLIQLPHGHRGGSVVEPPVALIDVAPTLLDYLNLPSPTTFQGVSLRSLIEGSSELRDPAYVFSETDRFNVKRRAIRGARYKLIVTEDTGRTAAGVPVRAGIEFYDLQEDPSERQNLYDPEDPRVQTLLALLQRMNTDPTGPTENPEADLTQEQLEMLRSLGYVR